MTFTEKVSCPNCGVDNGTRVRNSADICQCGNCGLVYLRTRPPVKQMEDWYQNYHSNPGSHMALPTADDQIKKSGLRRDYFMNEIVDGFAGRCGGGFIDVGAGWGAFLDNARDHGFEVAGCEICRGMAEFAQTRLNIPVATAQLEECDFRLLKEPVSVVSLIHTLEHLPSTQNALNYIWNLLKPGGWICGIVPNFGSLCSQTMRDQWPWLDANWHYTHYSPDTLRDVLIRHRFNPARIYTKSGDFDPTIIQAQIRIHEPNVHAISERITELEAEGRGEECRFFAQKEA